MKKAMSIILALLIVAVILSGSGCMGFGNGYMDKAQTMTSEKYSYEQYQSFINDYNSIRMAGANILNAQRAEEQFVQEHGNPEFYTKTQEDNYQDLKFTEQSYITQYNLFVNHYDSRMRDITKNQVWMKPQNFPEYIEPYVKGKPIINEEANPKLTMPNEMPEAPPGWMPPQK